MEEIKSYKEKIHEEKKKKMKYKIVLKAKEKKWIQSY